MPQKRWYVIIFSIFSLVGLIYFVGIDRSLNILISWILIGFWFCYTIKFFDRVKNFREFNSPHNTSFFIFGSISMGIFYSFWGNFNSLLGWNILQNPYVFLSFWHLIFAFPYLFYGTILLIFCFSRYFFVYIGEKSVSSRKYGGFVTVFIILVEIIYSISFYFLIDFSNLPLTPIQWYPDLLVFILSIISSIILIYGIFSKSSYMPVVPTEPIRRPTPTPRSIPPRPTPQPPIASQPRARQRPRPNRTVPTTRSQPPPRPKPPPPTRITPKPSPQAVKPKLDIKIDKIRPKAGRLSEEDFKCIFCFNLPRIPEDANRGIILCPVCRHPAHADEFRDWTKNSNLCSRCDAEIPERYRKNPNVIPVKIYLKVYHKLRKNIKRN
ncbi:MAG: hypothetical protein EAX96_13005 [Candidatus Lokiarchaeota archaeon]|nr:hypothetical protein [Candidatus Lokiarchaeota archaeon]